MPTPTTRTLAETPWVSLLPPEQRAALEHSYDDPDAGEWDALVAADRALEDDFAGPSGFSRTAKPLAAAAVMSAMLLAFDASSVAEQRTGSGGSAATASGTVTAPAAVAAARTVPEENHVALTSRSPVEVAETTTSGKTKTRKPRAPKGVSPAAPPEPPPAVGEPEPLVSTTLPVVGEVEVPAPQLELPGVELPQAPQLPPLQLPQLPQLPPLLPPSRR